MKIKQILFPTLALLIVCVAASAALALTNEVTKDRIAAQQQQKTEQAMAAVLPADRYEQVTQADGAILYAAYQNGAQIGWVGSGSAKGYGGVVEVMTGVDLQRAVTAIEIVSCADETPGLGQNVDTPAFKQQFAGISGSVQLGENIDAVTGATISSAAVRDAVNQVLTLVQQEGTQP